ncbi:MAG: DUF4976 domain-containing protein, partial [Acidobacteriota bacterium]|nr:DUF4976 domain-containing protein [Acidobacteriota bacterium]
PKGSPENSGRVESKIIENTDLLPTIFEAVGMETPAGVQGQSFLKLARGNDPGWKDRCYSQLATAMVRTPQWKLIDNSRNLSGTFELYDMRNDPKEERNVADDSRHRDLVENYKRQLTVWRADKPAPVKIPGMSEPAYTRISAEERRKIVRNAPDNR